MSLGCAVLSLRCAVLGLRSAVRSLSGVSRLGCAVTLRCSVSGRALSHESRAKLVANTFIFAVKLRIAAVRTVGGVEREFYLGEPWRIDVDNNKEFIFVLITGRCI